MLGKLQRLLSNGKRTNLDFTSSTHEIVSFEHKQKLRARRMISGLGSLSSTRTYSLTQQHTILPLSSQTNSLIRPTQSLFTEPSNQLSAYASSPRLSKARTLIRAFLVTPPSIHLSNSIVIIINSHLAAALVTARDTYVAALPHLQTQAHHLLDLCRKNIRYLQAAREHERRLIVQSQLEPRPPMMELTVKNKDLDIKQVLLGEHTRRNQKLQGQLSYANQQRTIYDAERICLLSQLMAQSKQIYWAAQESLKSLWGVGTDTMDVRMLMGVQVGETVLIRTQRLQQEDNDNDGFSLGRPRLHHKDEDAINFEFSPGDPDLIDYDDDLDEVEQPRVVAQAPLNPLAGDFGLLGVLTAIQTGAQEREPMEVLETWLQRLKRTLLLMRKRRRSLKAANKKQAEIDALMQPAAAEKSKRSQTGSRYSTLY
ncbi:MAG: hypothetical protein Q9161_004332 [Pseudevernia consocians]